MIQSKAAARLKAPRKDACVLTVLHGSAWGRRGAAPSMVPECPPLPFKTDAACRHRILKQRRRVANWAEYDAALR